jgi:hypothetical protein
MSAIDVSAPQGYNARSLNAITSDLLDELERLAADEGLHVDLTTARSLVNQNATDNPGPVATAITMATSAYLAAYVTERRRREDLQRFVRPMPRPCIDLAVPQDGRPVPLARIDAFGRPVPVMRTADSYTVDPSGRPIPAPRTSTRPAADGRSASGIHPQGYDEIEPWDLGTYNP